MEKPTSPRLRPISPQTPTMTRPPTYTASPAPSSLSKSTSQPPKAPLKLPSPKATRYVAAHSQLGIARAGITPSRCPYQHELLLHLCPVIISLLHVAASQLLLELISCL